ncbi:unnamed protein product [Acanthoscelides obtectus]|uniref:Uncharacterized protein n=1 Tax=Acanthoscelides obtectus TaxID=200917 RepID=A0A9P0LRG1_ACAOB|nr:unnamed protein product [Acanthoscelides obtectus]CAK1670412.1 hypothetical protein AOBTE_LOCUS27617 [Acanthoscelides obtectus]
MFKVTLQGHSKTRGHTSRSLGNSRSHFKVTRKTQGHTSRSLGNSRSCFKDRFQGWHRRSALKVVWHRRSALKSVPEHTNPSY